MAEDKNLNKLKNFKKKKVVIYKNFKKKFLYYKIECCCRKKAVFKEITMLEDL